jgi:hypothetical protein
VEPKEKTSPVAPLVGGFALGAMCGLLLASSRRRRLKGAELYQRVKHLLPKARVPAPGSVIRTPQELAEEFDLTANL